MTEDKNEWPAIVSRVINFDYLQKLGELVIVGVKLLAYQYGPGSV